MSLVTPTPTPTPTPTKLSKNKKLILYGVIAVLLVGSIILIWIAGKEITKTNDILADLEESNQNPTLSPTIPPTSAPIQEPTIPSTIPATPPPTIPAASGETSPPVTLPALEYIAPYCGKDTIFDANSQTCVYYAEDGSNSLSEIFKSIKDKLISVNGGLKVRDKPLANIPAITKTMPEWFVSWDSKGRYNANNLLSGANTFGEGINCSCGDCAAWRGGNAGSCVGNNSEGNPKDNTHRVACDAKYDPDRCVCAYPYTPVGGLCVIPYKFDPSVDYRPCCTSCVYEETCIGKEECKGVCEEQLVEYPGVRYICKNVDLDTTNPEIVLSQTDFDSKCSMSNEYNGMNEYECAYTCRDSQIGCSKRCLPKLWKWKKLKIEGSEDLVGFVQTDDLEQFEPESDHLDYCPPGDSECRTNSTISENDMQNCENCTDCVWELNEITKEYEYSCGKCESCTLNKPNGTENGFRTFETVKCNNVSDCRGCTKLFDPLQSKRNTITCNFCNTSSGDCIVEPKKDYQPQNTNNLKTYNKGGNYDPSIISLWENWYSGSDFGSALSCSVHNSTPNCSSGVKKVNGKDRQGYLEGGALGWFDVYNKDCTGNRFDCRVPTPKGKLKSDKPLCYSGKYYSQMSEDINCQKLPLPDVQPLDDRNLNIKTIVREGVAKGLSKDECKQYFCNKWDWDSDKWTPIDKTECDAVCEPDLFRGFLDIPEFANTNEQIELLVSAGKSNTCFGGKEIYQVSGDCTGITSLPRPPSGVGSPNVCDVTEFGDCEKTNCELYKGGALNTCGNDFRKPLGFLGFVQRQTCNSDNKCECAEGTCYQSGLCLGQSDNKTVKYGLAKGLPEWQCPYYFCQFYNRETEEWEGPTNEFGYKACSAMCLPELYTKHKEIPTSVYTTEQQVLFLTNDNIGNANDSIIQPIPAEARCVPREDGGGICSIM